MGKEDSRAVGSATGEDNTVGAGGLVVAITGSVDLAVGHDGELGRADQQN